MNKSLGLVEVKGLALAIQTVDVMAKSANIEILGLESTNGSGWTLIKVAGDVGSVNAAVDIGMTNALKQDGLISHKVIARSGAGVETFISEKPAVVEKVSEAEVAEKVKKSVKTEPRPASKAAPKKGPAKKGDKA